MKAIDYSFEMIIINLSKNKYQKETYILIFQNQYSKCIF